MLPVKKESFLSAVSDGTALSTRIVWTPPYGYGSIRGFAYTESTRVLLSTQWGVYDGANQWLLFTVTQLGAGMAEYSPTLRDWYAIPNAALGVGLQMRIQLVYFNQ